ncbi:MAG: 16S rRNA (uracil(1498)-N(3))-methyltransferase [Nitrosospira sp.]|nr:16S rRNA (uracil(1498)-N(3))-methyltransferase [Nitrosospira sp.]
MTLPRFYCPGELYTGQIVELPVSIANHAIRALRLGQGDEMTLFNGKGGEFRSVIARIAKSGATAVIGQHLAIERESRLAIALAQAICASEKMDWIVQKAVEMGVGSIQPLNTKLSVVRLSGVREERRVSHLQKVVISACEQSGRNRVPQVLPLASLNGWLGKQIIRCRNLNADGPSDLCFLLSPDARKGLRDFSGTSGVAAATLLVGPEGGFAPDEEEAALVAGFVPLRLGERTLRTESAALAAVAAMQALWGDY